MVLSFTCATFILLVFPLRLHDGQMDSVKKASPNRERLLRTHRTSAQISAMRMDRDRKSWHFWESSSTDRRSAVRAMIRDVERGQHWTVFFLLSLALQPQVSRRLRAIFSRRLTCSDFFTVVSSPELFTDSPWGCLVQGCFYFRPVCKRFAPECELSTD